MFLFTVVLILFSIQLLSCNIINKRFNYSTTLNRVGVTHGCDGRTDGQTDKHAAFHDVVRSIKRLPLLPFLRNIRRVMLTVFMLQAALNGPIVLTRSL